jgi:class 3 adenylate cyclase
MNQDGHFLGLQTQNLDAELIRLSASLKQSERIQAELDRRVFHLKTLYDVSKDLFSSVEPETILRNGLLMAMGNFGIAEGFVALVDPASGAVHHIVSMGFEEGDAVRFQEDLPALRATPSPGGWASAVKAIFRQGGLSPAVELVVPFEVEADCTGFLALGKKLVEKDYSDNDRELIDTLANNLAVAVKNARSFSKIKALNVQLETTNQDLEKTLSNLQAALRKVEILESLKSNFCKFVPASVTRLVEKSPTGEILEAQERDVTVLFLDIEGYTRLTEQIGATQINALTERYFSVFMDAIFENNGDVVETAGDGLMVLFLTGDTEHHALEAVRAAQTIMAKTCQVNYECRLDSHPIVINIGICSGQAFVGASKFESLYGGRWTYTSHGTTTNVAARLCGHAAGGAVLVSKSTAERVKGHFDLTPLGRLALKNLSEKVEVFALKESA